MERGFAEAHHTVTSCHIHKQCNEGSCLWKNLQNYLYKQQPGKANPPRSHAATGKVPQDLKNLPVRTFNKTVRSRVVGRNDSLLNSILSTNVSKDLVLELRAIVSEKDSGSHDASGQDQQRQRVLLEANTPEWEQW